MLRDRIPVNGTIMENATTTTAVSCHVNVCQRSPCIEKGVRHITYIFTFLVQSFKHFKELIKESDPFLMHFSQFLQFFRLFPAFSLRNSLNRETNSLLSLGGQFLVFFFFIASSQQISLPERSESSAVQHSRVCCSFRFNRPFLLL